MIRARQIVFTLVLILIVIPTAWAEAVSPFSLPVSTVVLDAGHGGHDPGALAEYQWNGTTIIQEKEIVLDITRQTAAYLQQWYPDLNVVLTRNDDTFLTLRDRADITVNVNPQTGKMKLFVSIHANASQAQEASGFEILVKRSDTRVRFLDQDTPDWAIPRYANHTVGELNQLLNQANFLFAYRMQSRLREEFPGMRDRGIKEQDVWVLNASKTPSVLVEVGFMSNEQEAGNLIDPTWRSRMALAIARAIADSLR